MLDTKKVGIRIASLRKNSGLSQEKLADMICISPQAISKWENGHTLPETTLLPVLSQIFGCTIDEIIMPAYSFDEAIESEKPTLLQQQAEFIAKHVLQNMEGRIVTKETIGFDDNTIINSLFKVYPNIGYCTVNKGNPVKNDGTGVTIINITVSAPQREFKLIERIYSDYDTELYRYRFVSKYINNIPQIYHIDFEKKIVLMEDLSENYIQGYDFDEDNENGNIIRANYSAILSSTAKLHSVFWENNNAFEQIGPDWRLESKENLLAHIGCIEKAYLKYRKDEEEGQIPKVWNAFENTIKKEQLDYFYIAIQYLKDEYTKLIDSRFHAGKNITIVHGDLHPGQTYLSKTDERTIKFVGFHAVRIGLCTEDLAMLLALHIEPEKKRVIPLLDYYYQCLSEKIKDYSYETFINDYKISIAENMFFTIKLMKSGIYDFQMRDKAMKAFETFVLESN